MTDQQAQDFADAVARLEQDRDVDAFVADRFTPDAELIRPEAGGEPEAAAGPFWQQYLAQFADITSTFGRVSGAGDLGVLEWTSTGHLAGGADISYAGVSILDFAADGRVRRFATYYDTQAFGAGPVA